MLIAAEKAAGLDARELLAITALGGAKLGDRYEPDHNGVPRLMTSGVRITVSGTDVTEINLNLTEAANVAGADSVIVQGTSGDDVVLVAGDASGTSVFGLAAQVNITGADSTLDRLTVNALAGDDVVEASSLLAGAIQLTANGGDGSDVLVGGDAGDVLLGAAGDDVLIGGPGIDILDGGDGDNVVIQ